jgi:hypothetical protein
LLRKTEQSFTGNDLKVKYKVSVKWIFFIVLLVNFKWWITLSNPIAYNEKFIFIICELLGAHLWIDTF